MGKIADTVEASSYGAGEEWRALEGIDYFEARIGDVDDARAVVDMLEGIASEGGEPEGEEVVALGEVVGLFETADTDEAIEVLAEQGFEQLRGAMERVYPVVSGRQADQEEASAILKALIAFAEFGYAEDAPYIVRVLEDGVGAELPGWWRVFRAMTPDNPITDEVFERLDGLPAGLAGLEFLTTANALAAEGVLEEHPYDSDTGRARLRAYLNGDAGGAMPAADALSFVSDIDGLLELARAHPDDDVRLAAAGTAAARGDQQALEELVEAAQKPAKAFHALGILDENDMLDAVPDEVFEDDFQACAEMCTWLSHPNEYGQPPDAIELVDHREAHWPPTDDTRPLWMFEYEYEDHAVEAIEEAFGEAYEPGEGPERGLGMVGSVTFALASATGDEELMDVGDAYALHCCYELMWNDDPRAPEHATPEVGHELLDW